MFRRLESSLPKDAHYPANLEELGYFINENDQIRMIKDPSKRFHYFISKNERHLEMHGEAMDECVRKNILSRLGSSMNITRLPLGTSIDQAHVPVLISKNLAAASRVIVYIGESCQDLAVFARRTINSDSIAVGSAIDFAESVHALGADGSVGLIISNPGQLVWYRRDKRAMTLKSWHALPRKNEVAPSMALTAQNHVPYNEDIPSHVSQVFEDVVEKLVSESAKIEVIGVGDCATEVVEYLQQNWKRWNERIRAIVVGVGYIWDTDFADKDFAEFWSKMARAYILSSEPIMTPLEGRDRFGCNCYAAGEPYYVECIMPRTYKAFLDYFEQVNDMIHYENIPQRIPRSPPANADGIDLAEETSNGNPISRLEEAITSIAESHQTLPDHAEEPITDTHTLVEVIEKMTGTTA